MPFRIFGILALCAFATACAYPVSTVEQGGSGSSLSFSNAPTDARAWIDGSEAGAAAAFDGKKTVLSVSPGRHQVVVKSATATLYDKPVYVGAGSRVDVKVP